VFWWHSPSICGGAVFILGYVNVRAKISDPEQTRTKELEFLVDTGASYMVIRPRIADELGLKRLKKTRVTLADKREVEVGYTLAYVSLLGREAPVTALVFDSPMPLLGTFTLQVLGLEADPTKHEIRPSRPFALGLMHVRPGKAVGSTS
jgi:clan AA aspartic protease